MTQITSSRGQELANRLQETTSEFAAFVDSLTPQEWAMRGRNAPDWQLGEDEKRPVGTIAYHTASILRVPHESLVRDAAEGRALDPVQGWSVGRPPRATRPSPNSMPRSPRRRSWSCSTPTPPVRWTSSGG